MTEKTKNVLLGIIPSLGMIVLGILFLLGGVQTLINVMDWIISILAIVAGIALLVLGIVRTKTIFNTSGLFGAFVLLIGVLWLPKVVAKLSLTLFIDLALWIIIIMGALLFIDGFLAIFIRKVKIGGVVEIIVGVVALVLGILIVANVLKDITNYVIGALLLVFGILYLIDIILDGKIGIVVRR